MLQKRLDYGFIGYQVPKKPRATRSARVNMFCFSCGADYHCLIYLAEYQNNSCNYSLFNIS